MNGTKLSFSGRYFFTTAALFMSIIFILAMIAILTEKSDFPGDKNYIGIIIFCIGGVFSFSFQYWISFNMAREIIIDGSCIRILKSKDYKIIPFSQIKHITFSTGKLHGLRYIWIKKRDDIDGIETSFLSISTFYTSNIDEKLEILLNELEKRTTVKKTRII